jgi:hypothetical protein
MKCRQCGAENEERYKFCGACGVPLTIPEVAKGNLSHALDRSKCPYCATVLEIAPKRKKPCPKCGQLIYVRKGVLLTEEDAEIHDWLGRLGCLNLTRDGFELQRQALGKELGYRASIDDTIWRILNLQTKARDLQLASFSYHEMARIAGSEGRDFKPYLVEALRAQLLDLKSQGMKTVKVMGNNDSAGCRKCKSLDGKRFPIDVALAKMPIPNLCTDEGGCRCWYAWAGDIKELLDSAVK